MPGPEAVRTDAGEALQRRVARQRQDGMRHMVKASLLVTTGMVPTNIAAQTLVG
jgi:hypothetical protein